MKLQEFHVVDGPPLTHLFFLRALRLRLDNTMPIDGQLNDWLEGTGVTEAARLSSTYLKKLIEKGKKTITVSEVYPGVGVTFEYLKYVMTESSRDIASPPNLSFHAIGQETNKVRFEVLHADGDFPVTYHVESDFADPKVSAALRESDLVILNHNQALYDAESPLFSVYDILKNVESPMAVCLRVSTTAEHRDRMTVRGQTVTLPVEEEVLNFFRNHGSNWFFQLMPGFDSEYFLPEGEDTSGLLLAYNFDLSSPIKGFIPI